MKSTSTQLLLILLPSLLVICFLSGSNPAYSVNYERLDLLSTTPCDHHNDEPKSLNHAESPEETSLQEDTEGEKETRAFPTHNRQSASSLLSEPLSVIQKRVSAWRDQLPSHYSKAQYGDDMDQHSHARFHPFAPMANCTSMQEVGRNPKTPPGKFDDDSKKICGLDDDHIFQREGCIIYSIGGNNEWTFETDLLEKTKCEIHTFDCTGPRERFNKKPSNPRSVFHHLCLGDRFEAAQKTCNKKRAMCGDRMTLAQLQRRLNHTHVDLIKMDIEGFEVPLFHSWWRHDGGGGERVAYPVQMMVELHYKTFPRFAVQIGDPLLRKHMAEQNDGKVIQSATDLLLLQNMLLDMGYVVVSRDDNTYCRHCTELVFLRIPPSQLFPAKPYMNNR